MSVEDFQKVERGGALVGCFPLRRTKNHLNYLEDSDTHLTYRIYWEDTDTGDFDGFRLVLEDPK